MIKLDESQQAAAGIRPAERQLIFAGPGAGKSEVVGALAAQLVESGIYPEEILIISFSRAAVDVVRRRTSVADEGRNVDVATIDSLGARLLTDHAEDDVRFTSYDRTIKNARKLIIDSGTPLLEHLRHVIIDEVQDIVGVRAEFVLALLAQGVPSDVGFTLLGDPLQALYDFQLSGGADITSDAFLNMIRMRWAPTERQLTGEYRSGSDDARRISEARSKLIPMTPRQRLLPLRAVLADLAPLGELDAAAAADIDAWDGSTSLLCDTNARAVLCTDALARHGFRSHHAASALDPGIPAWISAVVVDRSTGTLSHDDFLDRAEQLNLSEPDQLWWALIELAAGPRGIDLNSLVNQLSDPRQAARLGSQSAARIVASTVHRAKGLEFDNVVLIDPEDWRLEEDRPEGLASMLYVALSRGRQRVTVATGMSIRGWSRDKSISRRPWVWRGFHGRGASKLIIEPADARALGPVDHDLSRHIGAPVRWHRTEDHLTVEDDAVPSWIASVDDEPVARTGIEFGRTVGRLRFSSWGPYPGLTGGRVESLETIVDPRATDGRRMWTGARVAGVVQLNWRES